MYVVILAAGQSKRFQDAGYKIPKPFLKVEWRGAVRPMIIHVINSLPRQFTSRIIAAPPGHEQEMEYYDSLAYYISTEGTKGPAHTLQRVLHHLPNVESTLILDCDVLNYHLDLYNLTKEPMCSVLVSPSIDPSCSYVDKVGNFTRLVEKEVISYYAVRGAYYIPRLYIEEFILTLEMVVAEKDEPYISHVFNAMQVAKYALQTTYLPIDWGTPEAIIASGAKICT